MGFRRLDPIEVEEDTRQSPKKRLRRLDPTQETSLKQTKVESVLSAGTKGLGKGVLDLGTSLGANKLAESYYKELMEGEDAPPFNAQETRQRIDQRLDQILPSQEGFAESTAERAGRMIPGFALSPGGALRKAASVLGGALSGQAAEESGAGPWGQAGAEILGSILAGAPSAKLRPKSGSRQEQLIDLARRQGLSEKEIAPAIQSEKKISLLAPLAHKGRSTVKKIEDSRSAIGRIYQNLEKSEQAKRIFSEKEQTSLLMDLTDELQSLPRGIRNLIVDDAKDLLKSQPNAASLMNFYRDVNYYIGKGNGRLGGVRKVLEDHLTTHLGEDFKAANELFANVRKLGIRVRPDLASHFHDFRIASDLSSALLQNDKRGIMRAVAEIASRLGSSKFLTSPYLQHIPQKLLDSAKRGSVEDAKKILTIMLNKADGEVSN